MREVKIGQKYRHFKGHIVEVLCVAKHSETEENMVIYKHLGTDEYWARPYDMFLSKVDRDKYPEVKQIYRMEEID